MTRASYEGPTSRHADCTRTHTRRLPAALPAVLCALRVSCRPWLHLQYG